jgi:hypothetical protein
VVTRGHRQTVVALSTAGLVLAGLTGLAPPASAVPGSSTFTQSAGVFLGDDDDRRTSEVNISFEAGGGPASVYPSVLPIPHSARILDVNVTVEQIRHTNPDDIQLLLVKEGGPQVTLMANAGGSTDLDPVSGTSLFFDDEAAQALPDEGPLFTSFYRPGAYGTINQLPLPAPPVTGNTSLSVFDGLLAGGNWSLFAFDDDGTDFTGSIERWRLEMSYATAPYPSELSVSGVGTVQDVDVTLHGFTSEFPDDAELLLVGPSGQQATLMSDSGTFADTNDIELTFDDEAAGDLPRTGFDPIPAGSYRPTNFDDDHGPDFYPAPAPAATGGASLAVFDGTDPNGTWRLFAYDDDGGLLTRIERGWSLDIDWDDSAAPTGSVSVAGGVPTVMTSAVTLTASATDPAPATGVTQMRFSNDGQAWSPFQPYAATAPWTLSKGDGTKTVYAQFRDSVGNVSAAVSDSIVLDTKSPRAKKLKPRRNADDVRPRARVRVVATEALAPASITKSAVVLRLRGAKVKAAVSYVPSRHAIRLVPSEKLQPGTYTVKVKTQVTDVVGNRFDAKNKPGLQPLVWTFEVG